jgi:hypothetical protein
MNNFKFRDALFGFRKRGVRPPFYKWFRGRLAHKTSHVYRHPVSKLDDRYFRADLDRCNNQHQREGAAAVKLTAKIYIKSEVTMQGHW